MAEGTEETDLQAFVRALHAAYDASRSVDTFNLRSEDPASAAKWNRLVASQRTAFLELHGVCRRVPAEALSDSHE